MIDYMLQRLSQRFLTDKGRRMLFITALFYLLRDIVQREISLDEFNQRLKLVHNVRGLDVVGHYYRQILSQRICNYAEARPDKFARYIRFAAPKWLRYDSNLYQFDRDLQILESMFEEYRRP